jgi:hypothetical protein
VGEAELPLPEDPVIAGLDREMEALRYALWGIWNLCVVEQEGQWQVLRSAITVYEDLHARYAQCLWMYDARIAQAREFAALQAAAAIASPYAPSGEWGTPTRQEAAPEPVPEPVFPDTVPVTAGGAQATQVPAAVERVTTPMTDMATSPHAPRGPRVSLVGIGRRFVAEHAILILSYAGAFLLIVAALLFQLYGPSGMPGSLRLAVVASLNAFFGVAAFFCWRHDALRVVAASYTAIAAFMAPLTATSAYVFVLRDATSLTATAAVALAAAACAVSYGLVARALTSRAYASLSLIAFAIAGVSACVAVGTGPSGLPLAAVFICASWLLARQRASPFAIPAMVAAHAASGAAALTAIAWAATEGASGALPHFLYLPLTLLAVAASYGLRYLLDREDVALLLAGVFLSCVPVSAAVSVGWGVEGVALSLAGLGLVSALASHARLREMRLPRLTVSAEEVASSLAKLAVAEIIGAASLPLAKPGVQTAVVVAAVLGGLLLTAEQRSAWWLTVGVAALVTQVFVDLATSASTTAVPAYVPVALAMEFVAIGATGLRRRDRRLMLPASLVLVAATLSAGSTLGWSQDARAAALMGVAVASAIAAWRIPVRMDVARALGLHVGPRPAADQENAMAWLAALEVIGATCYVTVDPVLQLMLLSLATACGLLFALTARSPWWLLLGVGALAAQVIAHSSQIQAAGHAPVYVPATLWIVLATLLITAVVFHDRRLTVLMNPALLAAVLTTVSALALSSNAYAVACLGVAAAGAAAAVLVPVRVPIPAAAQPAWSGLINVPAWLVALEAVVAGSILVSDPYLQFAVLAAAIGCGLFLALVGPSPWWLATGVIAVGAHLWADASNLANATQCPFYVPAALAIVLASLAVTAVVQRDRWLVCSMNLVLVAATVTAANALGWSVDGGAIAVMTVALIGAAGATQLPIARRTVLGLALGRDGLANPLAWLATLEAVAVGLFPVSDTRVQFIVLIAAAVVGLVLAFITTSPWWLATGVAALAAQVSVHGSDVAVDGKLAAFVPATLAAVLAVTITYALIRRDRRLLLPISLCLTAAVLTANSTLDGGMRGYAGELVILAWVAVLTTTFIRSAPVRYALFIGAGLRLCGGAVLVFDPAWAEATLLAGAAACALCLAWRSRWPEWLFLAGMIAMWAWYWAAEAIGGVGVDPESIATAFGPVPFILGAAAVLVYLRGPRVQRMRWALPPLALGIVTAAGADASALELHAWTLLGCSLLLTAAFTYGAARAGRNIVGVYVAAAFTVGATFALLAAIEARVVMYPLVLAALAWMIWLAGRLSPRETDRAQWRLAHQRAALAISTLAVAAPLISAIFVTAHDLGPLVVFVASLSLAAIVWTGVSHAGALRDRYVAVLIAGLALDWLAAFSGTGEVQAYVIAPGVTLVVCGLWAREDPQQPLPARAAQVLIGAGAAAMLGTTAIQALATPDASGYTVLLLAEGLLALATGVGSRTRLLVIMGAAAILGAAVRALVSAVQVVPLYLAFGTAALILLATATVLAMARARVRQAGHSVREAWATWG